jgi:hypothetical protein
VKVRHTTAAHRACVMCHNQGEVAAAAAAAATRRACVMRHNQRENDCRTCDCIDNATKCSTQPQGIVAAASAAGAAAAYPSTLSRSSVLSSTQRDHHAHYMVCMVCQAQLQCA